jgi:hypothetical protein
MPGRTERLRQLIRGFNSRRFDEYAAAFHEDVVIEYPQSGERIHGRANALAMFGAFATAPTFDVWRIDASGDIAVVHATGLSGLGALVRAARVPVCGRHDRTRDGVLRRRVPPGCLAKPVRTRGELHTRLIQGATAFRFLLDCRREVSAGAAMVDG